MSALRSTRGQASVELVAMLPVLGALLAGCWQAVVAGHCWWLAGVGARAAARAEAVGSSPLAAARRALPPGRRPGLRVTVSGGGAGQVTVRVPVPAVVPGVRLGRVSATAGPRGEGR
ncbi:MAG: pilus assembly protein [Solirubrobacterales bacterium]